MSRETRLFLFFVLWLGIVIVFMWLFPTTPKTNLPADKLAQTNTYFEKPSQLVNRYNVKSFSNVINTNNVEFYISHKGFEKIYFSYDDRIYSLFETNYIFTPFSMFLSSVIKLSNNLFPDVVFDESGKSVLELSNGNIVFERELIPVSNYIFDIVLKVKNSSKRDIIFNGFSIAISGPLGPETIDEHFAYLNLRTGYIDKLGNVVETLTTSLFTGTERYSSKDAGNVSGVWMENKYTIVGIVPLDDEFRAEFLVYDTKYGHNKVISLRSPNLILEKGSEKIYKFRVLLGPKKNHILESFGYGFKNLEDGGILKPIYDFFGFLLKPLYTITGSWGLAVVLFSIFAKLLLEPLSIKSAISMKRLQLIAPKVKEVQEKYKDDPKKANAEIAELYRIYGANPASGCLPLLLQIPIFIALYNVLVGLIELKGQSFLWIHDLTKPDTILYIKQLEGFFILPASINLLPIIMTITSLFQTYISSSKAQTQQTMTMWLLPIVFMFIFWNLPSALVMYWTIQTFLSAIEQYIINRVVKY
ncbi:MAG: membrane protein insertase YidC [Brevinematia bacterium]